MNNIVYKEVDFCKKATYIISMNFTNLNSLEQVLESLRLLHPVISEVMEASVAKAREYFEINQKEYNVYLFSDLVREEARERLDRVARNNIDLILAGFSRIELQNNGLEVQIYDYRIKILKGRKGLLPAAGRTRAKREFFFQRSLWDIDILNLVIIWDINESYELVELRLACPKSPQNYPETSLEHWSISIPPAPTMIVVDEPFDNYVDDLNIQPRELQDTGTDANTSNSDNEDS